MVTYSVIVPFYNSEKTLARCLNSLLSQGRQDIQVIAVNDGSVDSSEEIALNFAAKYLELDYVRQENAGVSLARNLGLTRAKGIYVTFVDSDDYVAEDYFSQLDQAADCDLLVFAHEHTGRVPLEERSLFTELINLDSSEKKLELLLKSRKIMSPWNKRFRNDLIQMWGLRFLPDMHTGEDFNFCMSYAVHCQSIEAVPNKLIFVDISNQDSLSRKYRPNLDQKLQIVFDQVASTIGNSPLEPAHKDQLLSTTDYLFVKHVFSCISEEFKKNGLHYFRDHQRIAQICRIFREPLSHLRCNLLHRILRILLMLRCYFPFYLISYWVKGRKFQNPKEFVRG